MKLAIIFAFIIKFSHGWEILTSTLDPPTNPILEGTDVTAKVLLPVIQELNTQSRKKICRLNFMNSL